MSPQTRIYVSGAFCFGESLAVTNLLVANYSTVILWCLHVHANADLFMNDTLLVTNGVYKEGQTMNLPSRLAILHKKGISVMISVGSGGVDDWYNIEALLTKYGTGEANPLYKNMAALRAAMRNAGGDIDAIDFDNEDNLKSSVMVDFAIMLQKIHYPAVTFCPAAEPDVWQHALTDLVGKFGPDFVSAVHLQCYSGGKINQLKDWSPIIPASGSNALFIPGLATDQTEPGPWWDKDTDSPGGSVKPYPNMAQPANGDWSTLLRQGNYASADLAMQSCDGPETFFFYCNQPVNIGTRIYKTGDAVFFGGSTLQWVTIPQCTGYALSNGCTNIYDPMPRACPKDIQDQFYTWGKDTKPINGGFIWMYDSIVNCVLSGPCGEGGQPIAQIAIAYKEAIIKGLGG